MTEAQEDSLTKKSRSINPVTAVLIAIVISLVVSAVNLLLFINSDMYQKVKLIQNPEQVLSSTEAIDESSPLSTGDLSTIREDISKQFELMREDVDFNVYDVSEVTLGM